MAGEEVRIEGRIPVARRTANALVTLAAMALVGQLLHLYAQYEERRLVRVERAEMAARRTKVLTAPTDDYFSYVQIAQIDSPAPPGGPLLLQSSFNTYVAPLTVQHEDVLRCTPPGGGEERFVSSADGSVTYDDPVAAGPLAKRQKGARKRSGLWEYGRILPKEDADCRVYSHPCAYVKYGIKKCQTIVSEPIFIRSDAAKP